jgi:tRNA threonylcarbamoyladenosine biosynthesis protein TsaB
MILAIDTSTPQIGLALYDGAQVVAESQWVSQARHTVELAPAVAEMLARTGHTIADVTALAVALGPGSFTSLRVGLSFVKGLALSRNLPLIGIPTLEVVAAPVAVDKRPLACLLPAGRGRLALAWFHAQNNGWQAEESPSVSSAEALAASVERDSVVAGDLTAAERSILEKNSHIELVSPALSTRRPGILAELAWRRLQAGEVDDIHTLAPLYLHVAEPIPAEQPGTVIR